MPLKFQTLFEACVESVEEAREAAARGADRVELCVDLAYDGCTPPLPLLAACSAGLAIPVIAMVRPRRGSFVYSPEEIAGMCGAMDALAVGGAAGFATGALTAEDDIDRAGTARLVASAGSLPVTFHRAVDRVSDLTGALETLVDLGVRRVLTSGGGTSAVAGLDMLQRLVEAAAGRIEVVAAGGVRPSNVHAVIAASGAPAVHARWSGWRHAPAGP